MATNEAKNAVKPDNKNCINQLLHSIGQLKFSLRALDTLYHQAAHLDFQESESQSEDNYTHESNKILGNVINDVLAEQVAKDKTRINLSYNASEHIMSVDELIMVNKKLHGELEEMRHHILDVFLESTPKA